MPKNIYYNLTLKFGQETMCYVFPNLKFCKDSRQELPSDNIFLMPPTNIFCYWTEAENNKLIEGLKMFGYNWEKIATHIGTKSAEKVKIKM